MKKKTKNAFQDKIDLHTLKESEARFRSIVLWSPDAIIVTDAKGKILYMNPAGEGVFNRKLESFIGKDFGLSLVNGESTEIDIFRPGKDPGVGDMHVVETEWLGEKAHLITIRDITGRKRAAEALSDSEMKFTSIFDHATDGIILVDIETKKFCDANLVMCDMLAYSLDEIKKMGIMDIHPQENLPYVLDQFEKQAKGEIVLAKDIPVKRKDGSVFYADISSGSIELAGKNYLMGIFRDITLRKQAEQRLRENEEKYRSIVENSSDEIFMLDKDYKFLSVNKIVADITGKSSQEMIGMSIFEVFPESVAAQFSKNIKDVFDNGKSVVFDEKIIIKGGEIYQSTSLNPVKDDRGIVTAVTGIVRDITERMRAAELLRESEEKYRMVVENANEAIIIIQDWKIVFVNCATVNLIGYSKEILTSKTFKDIIHPDDCNMVLSHNIGKIEGREVIPVDFFRVISQDGTVKWVELNSTVIHWKERPATLIFLNDTTERKLVEKALQKSEENFRLSLDDSPLGVRIVTTEGETLYANQAILKIYGYDSIEELKGTPLLERYTPESYAGFKIRKDKRERGEFDPSGYEINIVRKNGEIRHVQVFRKEIWWNSARQFQVVYLDITERRKTEEELFIIKKAVESSSDAIGISDPKGHHFYHNKAFSELFEYTPDELEAAGGGPAAFVDKKVAREMFDSIMGGGSWIGEVEMVSKSGRRIPILERADAIKDESGKIIGLIGLHTDITDRKRAEDELKKSENKYRLLADNVNDVIFSLDMNLKYTYVSPSVKILRGYEPEEVMKLSPIDSLAPSSMELAMNTIFHIMDLEKINKVKINEFLTIPLEVMRKDGTTVWTEVKFSFIRDKNQQPVGILGVTRDITERKLAEEKLLQTLENLEKSFSTTIKVMVGAVEMKDPYTAGHQLRAADLARAIATEMGMPQEKIDGIHMAGSIHDIGKLSVPSEILSKPTKLTNSEFTLIKDHAQSGYEMLKNVESPWPLAQIVYQHHERMNGTGYPRKLKGDEILMEARVMAVADVVEAMASHRPYRPALGIDVALDEIEKNKGILYDDAVAAACLRLFREKDYKLIV